MTIGISGFIAISFWLIDLKHRPYETGDSQERTKNPAPSRNLIINIWNELNPKVLIFFPYDPYGSSSCSLMIKTLFNRLSLSLIELRWVITRRFYSEIYNTLVITIWLTAAINPFQPSVVFHIETNHLIWNVSIWNATLK